MVHYSSQLGSESVNHLVNPSAIPSVTIKMLLEEIKEDKNVVFIIKLVN